MITRICVAALFTLLCLTPAFAQEHHSPEPTAAFAREHQSPKEELPAADPEALLPNVGIRVGRSLKLSWQLQDAADLVFATLERAPIRGGEPAQLEGLFQNPDQLTQRYTITLSPGSWFISPEERASAYSTARDALKEVGLPAPTGYVQTPSLDYFAGRASIVDWLGRSLSALSVSVTWAQRPRFLSGVFLGPDITGEDSRIRTINFKFDPLALMTTPEQYEAAYKAMDAYRTLYGKESDALTKTHRCDGMSLAHCLRDVAVSKRMKLATALVPTVELQSIDEFDFFKAGNRFVPFPDAQDSTIEALTFTWDLMRMFATSKDLAKGVALAKARNALAAPAKKD